MLLLIRVEDDVTVCYFVRIRNMNSVFQELWMKLGVPHNMKMSTTYYLIVTFTHYFPIFRRKSTWREASSRETWSTLWCRRPETFWLSRDDFLPPRRPFQYAAQRLTFIAAGLNSSFWHSTLYCRKRLGPRLSNIMRSFDLEPGQKLNRRSEKLKVEGSFPVQMLVKVHLLIARCTCQNLD